MEMLSEWGILAMWISNATGLMPKIEKHLKRWNLNVIATWAWLKVGFTIIFLLLFLYLLSNKHIMQIAILMRCIIAVFFLKFATVLQNFKNFSALRNSVVRQKSTADSASLRFHIEQRYFSMFAFQSEQSPNALLV